MSWETVNLGDLCSVITKGTTPSNIGASFTDRGIKYIRSEMLTSAKYITGDFLYISQETHERLKRSQLQTGDILFSMAGVYLGKTAILRAEDTPSNTNQAVALIRIDPNKCNNEYVYYYLNMPEVVKTANTVQSQSAQPNINLKQIGHLKIQLPDVDTQTKIVEILSAYDDLIENNQKQIKLLEEAAQRLYKEWFVDLRFPGYENTPIVDGVPEGWKKGPISSFFKTVLGGTPSREKNEYWGGNIPWINSGEVNKLRIIKESEFITELGLKKSATKLMPIHTTVLAITGATLGQVSYTEIETCANQSVVGIYDEHEEYSEYLYLAVSNEIKSIISKATGGAQQHINKDIVNKFEIVLPSKVINERLIVAVFPLFQKITRCYTAIEKLTETRDRLLPKLMSGEIEV